MLAACAAAAPRGDYVWKDGKWVPAAKPAEGTGAGELVILRGYVEQKERKKAVSAAKRFRKKYPGDPGREEATFLAGQAELDAKRYYQAYEWFEKQIDEHPNGRLLERALTREMAAAEAFLRGEKRIVGKIFRLPARDEGLEILRRIAEHAPGSIIAEKALLRIGEYHAGRGEHAEAAEAYDNYLQLFGKSRRAPEAMLKAARAMLASYKGVPYDETPLIEAEQRFKVIRSQYPATAKKARVETSLERITEIRAQRAWRTARFYARTGRPKAARFYYQQVIDRFPGSRWAAEARRALGGAAAAPKPKPAPATRPAGGSRPTTLPAGPSVKGGEK